MAEALPILVEDNKKGEQEKTLEELVSTLPKEKGWIRHQLHLYQGFWFDTILLKNIICIQQNYCEAQPTDVLLATYPKAGTTWLKALLFAITNRTHYQFHQHPLLTANPHALLPFLEEHINKERSCPVLSTHIPYASLPKSILLSGCPIVYVCRDPKDTFVSLWHYASKARVKDLPPLPLEEAFERFCKGVSGYGPFWDHVMGYWKASLERPDKVLFLRYEDMKSEPVVQVKKLAEFSGHPFSIEEESEGVIHKIVDLCSFKNLSNLEVNQSETHNVGTHLVSNKTYFREGKVGDWKNYLTNEMAEHLDQILKHKFQGVDLF